MTRKRMRLLVLLTVVAGSMLGALAIAQFSAEAQAPPDRSDLFLARLGGLRTWYSYWEIRLYSEGGNMERAVGGPRHVYTLRIDADGNQAVLDTRGKYQRFRWDGEHLTFAWHRRPIEEGAVYDYPPEVDAMVADVWAEMLAGFPNTQIVAESPMDRLPVPDLTAPRYQPSGLGNPPRGPLPAWWRFALPFDWAEYVWVYVLLSTDGRPLHVVALYRQTGEMVSFGTEQAGRWADVAGTTEQYWNVPLNPNISDPFPPSHQESFSGERTDVRGGGKNEESIVYGDMYHQTSTMVRPAFDPSSVGEIEEDGHSHSWQSIRYQTCTKKGPLATLAWDFKWNVTSQDDIDRLSAALAGQCPVKLTLEPWTGWVYDLGVTGTIQGMVQLRDVGTNPPTVLLSQPFGATRAGPQEAQGPHPISWSVPSSTNPDHLQVRLSGQLTTTCGTMRTPPQQMKQIGLKVAEDEAYAPLFSWFGCWPGW